MNLFIMFLIKHRIISVSFYKIISLEHHFRGKWQKMIFLPHDISKLSCFAHCSRKSFPMILIFFDLDNPWQWYDRIIIFLHFRSVWHRVWAILRLNIYLNERSPFCKGLFQLLRLQKIEGLMLAGLPWSSQIYWPESDDGNVETSRGFLSTLSLNR